MDNMMGFDLRREQNISKQVLVPLSQSRIDNNQSKIKLSPAVKEYDYSNLPVKKYTNPLQPLGKGGQFVPAESQ